MAISLAFDVYGTLIDTHGVVTQLEKVLNSSVSAKGFSQTWRDKQLEYSFRRGLMRQYERFSVCTHDALNYTCLHYGITLSDDDKQVLLGRYSALPAFDDVVDGLTALKREGFHLYAFSNGAAEAVESLLEKANIRDFFADVVSVDDLQTFKPNPDVYQHFILRSNSSMETAWLISSNPFDVIGALSAGLKAAWVKRSEDAVFDPWGLEPTTTITKIPDLVTKLLSQ